MIDNRKLPKSKREVAEISESQWLTQLNKHKLATLPDKWLKQVKVNG